MISNLLSFAFVSLVGSNSIDFCTPNALNEIENMIRAHQETIQFQQNQYINPMSQISSIEHLPVDARIALDRIEMEIRHFSADLTKEQRLTILDPHFSRLDNTLVVAIKKTFTEKTTGEDLRKQVQQWEKLKQKFILPWTEHFQRRFAGGPNQIVKSTTFTDGYSGTPLQNIYNSFEIFGRQVYEQELAETIGLEIQDKVFAEMIQRNIEKGVSFNEFMKWADETKLFVKKRTDANLKSFPTKEKAKQLWVNYTIARIDKNKSDAIFAILDNSLKTKEEISDLILSGASNEEVKNKVSQVAQDYYIASQTTSNAFKANFNLYFEKKIPSLQSAFTRTLAQSNPRNEVQLYAYRQQRVQFLANDLAGYMGFATGNFDVGKLRDSPSAKISHTPEEFKNVYEYALGRIVHPLILTFLAADTMSEIDLKKELIFHSQLFPKILNTELIARSKKDQVITHLKEALTKVSNQVPTYLNMKVLDSRREALNLQYKGEEELIELLKDPDATWDRIESSGVLSKVPRSAAEFHYINSRMGINFQFLTEETLAKTSAVIDSKLKEVIKDAAVLPFDITGSKEKSEQQQKVAIKEILAHGRAEFDKLHVGAIAAQFAHIAEGYKGRINIERGKEFLWEKIAEDIKANIQGRALQLKGFYARPDSPPISDIPFKNLETAESHIERQMFSSEKQINKYVEEATDFLHGLGLPMDAKELKDSILENRLSTLSASAQFAEFSFGEAAATDALIQKVQLSQGLLVTSASLDNDFEKFINDSARAKKPSILPQLTARKDKLIGSYKQEINLIRKSLGRSEANLENAFQNVRAQGARVINDKYYASSRDEITFKNINDKIRKGDLRLVERDQMTNTLKTIDLSEKAITSFWASIDKSKSLKIDEEEADILIQDSQGKGKVKARWNDLEKVFKANGATASQLFQIRGYLSATQRDPSDSSLPIAMTVKTEGWKKPWKDQSLSWSQIAEKLKARGADANKIAQIRSDFIQDQASALLSYSLSSSHLEDLISASKNESLTPEVDEFKQTLSKNDYNLGKRIRSFRKEFNVTADEADKLGITGFKFLSQKEALLKQAQEKLYAEHRVNSIYLPQDNWFQSGKKIVGRVVESSLLTAVNISHLPYYLTGANYVLPKSFMDDLEVQRYNLHYGLSKWVNRTFGTAAGPASIYGTADDLGKESPAGWRGYVSKAGDAIRQSPFIYVTGEIPAHLLQGPQEAYRWGYRTKYDMSLDQYNAMLHSPTDDSNRSLQNFDRAVGVGMGAVGIVLATNPSAWIRAGTRLTSLAAAGKGSQFASEFAVIAGERLSAVRRPVLTAFGLGGSNAAASEWYTMNDIDPLTGKPRGFGLDRVVSGTLDGMVGSSLFMGALAGGAFAYQTNRLNKAAKAFTKSGRSPDVIRKDLSLVADQTSRQAQRAAFYADVGDGASDLPNTADQFVDAQSSQQLLAATLMLGSNAYDTFGEYLQVKSLIKAAGQQARWNQMWNRMNPLPKKVETLNPATVSQPQTSEIEAALKADQGMSHTRALEVLGLNRANTISGEIMTRAYLDAIRKLSPLYENINPTAAPTDESMALMHRYNEVNDAATTLGLVEASNAQDPTP